MHAQAAIVAMTPRMVEDLRASTKDCLDRGLTVAAKWSSDLLLSIPVAKRSPQQSQPPATDFSTSTPARSRSPTAFANASPTAGPSAGESLAAGQNRPVVDLGGQSGEVLLLTESHLEAVEADTLVCARAHVDAKEFLRAVHILRDCKSSKARFISVYSRFLASEKKALRDWHQLDNNRHQPPIPVNKALLDVFGMVQNVTDPWLLFLKGLFLSRLSRREEAIESTLLSIAVYPWNWSAWSLLGSCVGDGDELSALLPLLPLPPTHPLVQMFQIKTLNELHNPSEHELSLCNRLLSSEFFPDSLWVMSLKACVLYYLHDFGKAETQFERILAIDPYRIDDIDIFSNILYVTENRLRLSRLAHEFLALDKDRPEVCCLVGNHYSMRSEREKAVKYFRRATQLDRTYLSAWTLMGHEYVEMKNSHAAIEAYRRAADVNRKDYRAWYGLGQAYELLLMPQYALYYYQRATSLRPYDVRLWQAQGTCFDTVGRQVKTPRDAIECFKRALIGADPHETKINLQLAKLYHDLEEYAEASAYHRRIVELSVADDRPIQHFSKSCLYVAQYHMTTPGGDLHLARDFLERVANSNASDVQEASDMLKTLTAKLQAQEDAMFAATIHASAVGD